ncbi:hypothetical protein SAMN02799624_06632 [Paenibacillus sp. UNC496MF]|uniref:hypothetical protein n=1 Tax=Paenibacillus sp. UNC496MF TaxID=1502753 RepID=UPI0008E14783|nr:hypothetical protein [Paenibacillus sp. UNC496MF]SFJ92987.1 hypothetical protein SAMN02799624_06632 [Paenibacillus sp. UNC496MF]
MSTWEKASSALLATLLTVTVLAGCADNNNGHSADTAKPESSGDQFQPLPAVEDSSDLPDWTGKQLHLKIWLDHGTGGTFAGARKYKDDLVTNEIARVTGVHIDLDNSFDNGGNSTGAVKMGMLAATNNWPDLILDGDELNSLVDNDKLYDLTDLLPKYAPNLMKKIPQTLNTVWDMPNVKKDGKVYMAPASIYETALPKLYPDLDPVDYPLAHSMGYVYVRDDILKKLYPQAKTEQEIQDLYMKNGKFTKEDILDVPIHSAADFTSFLYNIQKLGVKEGNQQVSPFFLYSGQDNWNLMTILFSSLYGGSSTGGENSYFTYWDKTTQHVEWGFKQPFFKDLAKQMNQLMRDGVASKEAMVDPYNVFQQKLNNGMYAVSYGFLSPDNNALAQAGKPYRYRKVYLDIPRNDDKFLFASALPGARTRIGIFKDSVAEEDLPQVLRWMDFLASDAGEKLWFWGPKSAGLFEEKDGQRVYTDKNLEAQMVYDKPGTLAQQYGLELSDGSNDDRTMSDYISFTGKGRYYPGTWYDKQRSPEEADTYFDMGRVERAPSTDTLKPTIYSFTSQIPEADKAWKARKAFEDALTKVLVAKDDTEFEKLFNDFLATAEKDGYTDDLKDKVDAAFRVSNKNYMANLQK